MSVGRLIGSYSDLEHERLKYEPPLPSIFEEEWYVEKGDATTAAGDVELVAKKFPHIFGKQTITFRRGEYLGDAKKPLRVGVVLSGGQAAGGHNVIAGLFDALKAWHMESTVIGFLGGPEGIIRNQFIDITDAPLSVYRNQGGFDMIGSGRTKIATEEQFKRTKQTIVDNNLDGLVIIGGDDSNTNAAVLAEELLKDGITKCKVVGVPKTIDGDLKNQYVEISFGFDSATKVYSNLIGNILRDAASARKYYHFIRLMGRAASHITLECGLQTHANVVLVGEEVKQKQQTLKEIARNLADVVMERWSSNKNYGAVLVPEGLIDFVPEVNVLIKELTKLTQKIIEEGGTPTVEAISPRLTPEAKETWMHMPKDIKEELIAERDDHGNIQLSKIETEKLLILMVAEELQERKKNGTYKGTFSAVSHFFGYEGRCCLPTVFDSNYTYALGWCASALISQGYTGYMATVGDLTSRPKNWIPGGIPLTLVSCSDDTPGRPTI